MWIERENVPDEIVDIVCKNTGMTKEELMLDQKNYRIDGLSEIKILLTQFMLEKRKIFIFGDYDVDGTCSAAILQIGFEAMRYADYVTVRLPKRISEGYGVSEKAIDEFKDGGVLITVDNGIAAIDAIKKAKKKGMFVIIVDHHLPQKDENGNAVFPDADLIIDPKALPGSADFDGYCGAGLAYRIMCQLVKNKKTLWQMLCLAAIATIADVMPLTMENRRIVRYGLHNMVKAQRTTSGLYALLMACEKNEFVTESDIGFKIAPCLNAPGRLYDDGAKQSFSLLSFDDGLKEAKDLADKQVEDNAKRRSISDECFIKAVQNIEFCHMAEKPPLVSYVPGIPEGIVGLVAGKLEEKYHMPCVMLTDSGVPGIIKGSARTYGDVNIFQLLNAQKDRLVKFGGHKEAAGLSLKSEDLEEFRKGLQQAYKDEYGDLGANDDLYYDMELDGTNTGLIIETFRDILTYGPYGQGNPAPVLLLKNVPLIPRTGGSTFQYIGEQHGGIKLFAQNFDCVTFSNVEKYEAIGAPAYVDLIGTVSINYYKGEYQYRFEFMDIREHEQIARKKSPFAAQLARKAAERTQERLGQK